MARSAASKSERINLRLDVAAKRKIEQAASLDGRTVSGFILSSALESADDAIRAHETMVLSRRDAEVFFDAIIDPPPPGETLANAMKEYRRRVVSR
jgi:uncharacterized protein (DUF1778 family)